MPIACKSVAEGQDWRGGDTVRRNRGTGPPTHAQDAISFRRVLAFAQRAPQSFVLQLLCFSDKQAVTAEDILHMSTTSKKRLYAPLACR